MMEQQKTQLGFTTIMHDPRLKFNLSNNEYCIADAIYHLSHNPQGAILGWCYASRASIGRFFGFSRQTVIKSIKVLVEKGLVEVHAETDYLRTTSLWYENFVLFKLQHRENKV